MNYTSNPLDELAVTGDVNRMLIRSLEIHLVGMSLSGLFGRLRVFSYQYLVGMMVSKNTHTTTNQYSGVYSNNFLSSQVFLVPGDIIHRHRFEAEGNTACSHGFGGSTKDRSVCFDIRRILRHSLGDTFVDPLMGKLFGRPDDSQLDRYRRIGRDRRAGW
jgi:hypothetical protein